MKEQDSRDESVDDVASTGVNEESTGVDATDQARPPKPRSSWIMAPSYDMLLIVATPLLIVPFVLAARARFTIEEIYLFVVAFGATGHHLPGMIRAYGDKALFRRFRVRFIAAPILLLAVCIGFAQNNLEGLIVLLLLWGFWHGLMQVYGFVRIYDAKIGSVSAVTARIDWFMCLTWFGMGLLWSPGRMEQIFREMYKAGFPLIDPDLFHTFQLFWLCLTGFVTLVFVINYLTRRNQGLSASPIKLIVMGTSFSFWWFCMVNIKFTLLGIALFEIFHDVQYLAIVWIYNLKRVDNDPGVGAFTKFLFRRNLTMIATYVLLVMAYGFVIGMAPSMMVSRGEFIVSIYGVMAASTFLHFYFDGFIWKVREQTTRQSLGLDAAGGRADRRLGMRTEVVHAMKWGLFIVPAAFIASAESRSEGLNLDSHENLARLVPGSWRAWHHYGLALAGEGSFEESVEVLKNAVDINDDATVAHVDLGDSYWNIGESDKAIAQTRHALELDPNLAIAHNSLGKYLLRDAESMYTAAIRNRSQRRLSESRERFNEARTHLERAVDLRPDDDAAWIVLGHYYRSTASMSAESIDDIAPDYSTEIDVEALKKAIEIYGKVVEINNDSIVALTNRAQAWLELREFGNAIDDYELALEIDPDNVELYMLRGSLHELQGDYDLAIEDFKSAAEHDEFPVIAHNELAMVYTTGPDGVRDLESAETHAARVCELTENKDAGALKFLSEIQVARNDYPAAIESLSMAIDLVPQESAFYFQRATLYRLIQEFDLAIADFYRCAESPETAIAAHMELSMTYLMAPEGVRDLEAAERQALIVCQLTQSRDPTAWKMVSDVRLAGENYDGAISALESARQLVDPSQYGPIDAEIQRIRALKDQDRQSDDDDD